MQNMWITGAFLPYQYPVAALLVDDDAALLSALWAGLSRERRVLVSDNNAQALSRYREARPVRRHFLQRSPDQVRLDEHRVVVDTTAITGLIDDPTRHEEIGLVVVDYQMPGGDGLELCEALRDEPCRRILLTGAADERVAVQAFNAGLIHQFVRKGPDTLEQLAATLRRQQQHYFHHASQALAEGLRERLGAFEHEPAVVDALQTLMSQLQVLEYYLCTEPNGLLVMDARGQRRRILVQSEAERRSALEIAAATGQDKALATAMVYVCESDGPAAGPLMRAVQPQRVVKGSDGGVFRVGVEAW